jgi:hypothetical protein
MKTLIEDIQKKNATSATEAITKALRAKTVAAIAEARKQVAVEMFGDLSEAPHQEHRRAGDKSPQSKGEKSQKRKDWDNNVRMPWPKDYVKRNNREPGSGMGTAAGALASHGMDEDEDFNQHSDCGSCGKEGVWCNKAGVCKSCLDKGPNPAKKMAEGEKGNPRQDVRDMKKGLDKMANRQMKTVRDQKFGKR